MAMNLPRYKVIVAFGYHRVGDVIEPTGVWRDRLLNLRYIARIDDRSAQAEPALLRVTKQKRVAA